MSFQMRQGCREAGLHMTHSLFTSWLSLFFFFFPYLFPLRTSHTCYRVEVAAYPGVVQCLPKTFSPGPQGARPDSSTEGCRTAPPPARSRLYLLLSSDDFIGSPRTLLRWIAHPGQRQCQRETSSQGPQAAHPATTQRDGAQGQLRARSGAYSRRSGFAAGFPGECARAPGLAAQPQPCCSAAAGSPYPWATQMPAPAHNVMPNSHIKAAHCWQQMPGCPKETPASVQQCLKLLLSRRRQVSRGMCESLRADSTIAVLLLSSWKLAIAAGHANASSWTDRTQCLSLWSNHYRIIEGAQAAHHS